MLADHQIRTAVRNGKIGIEPFEDINIQPASYDLTLSPQYRVPRHRGSIIDCRKIAAGHTMLRETDKREPHIPLMPGEFILASTVEKIQLPPMYSARVEGKSSLGRLGLAVHITAGFIDPGFEGPITLEIANLSPWHIWLWPGQRIAQIAFTPMDALPHEPYGRVGHYHQQQGPTESRFKI